MGPKREAIGGRSWLLATSFLMICACADARAAVKVRGVAPEEREWTVEQVHQKLSADVHVIEYTSRGQKHSAHAIGLVALLKASGAETELKMDPKADPKTKNRPLRLTILVKGNDGYTVAFSLAELLPDIGNRDAWLIFDSDEKPLPEGDGHVRLIVPGDQKPGRWVRDVESITILDSGRDEASGPGKPH